MKENKIQIHPDRIFDSCMLQSLLSLMLIYIVVHKDTSPRASQIEEKGEERVVMERLFSDIDDLRAWMLSEHDMEQYASHLLEEQLPAGNVDAVNMEVDHVNPSSSLLLAPPPNHQSSSMEANSNTEYSEANLRCKLDEAGAAVGLRFPNDIPSGGSYSRSSTDKGGETQTAKNMDPMEEKQLKRKLANRESARRSRKKKQDYVYELLEELARSQVECQKHKKENEVLRAQVKESQTELAKVQLKNRELEFKIIELSPNFDRFVTENNMIFKAQAERNKDEGPHAE
ncbi:uncharacterized protein [Elaeis guineensis]|uniref:uncharacterized protein n=1 Tax=Elaeis guineensis var. tenera TaxID=51953 RepID=UPI003C6D5E01